MHYKLLGVSVSKLVKSKFAEDKEKVTPYHILRSRDESFRIDFLGLHESVGRMCYMMIFPCTTAMVSN